MRNIEKDEWIGLNAKIKYNENEFDGKIIDETKNTITIDTKKGVKKILKKNSKIMINNQKINGDKITKRHDLLPKLNQYRDVPLTI